MNIQPNSHKIRKYIEPNQYFDFICHQRFKSLIGLDENWATSVYEDRLAELENYEKQGLIFFGEKNWLKCYLDSGENADYKTYDKWVKKNFTDYLNIKFEIDTDYIPSTPLQKAILPLDGLLLDYPELNNPAFQFDDELELYFGFEEPSAMHLCSLFDSLCMLQYSVNDCYREKQAGYDPCLVTGVDSTNNLNPYITLLNLTSMYGADYDLKYIFGRSWYDFDKKT